ncbi:SRR1-like protein [Limulus polyphemus]|uniref:SRR1-like protein n=1 Tax=Limulus polyphemus TaxID=6850 RepID=A0ABM1BIX0_LIMPO|nr:SRR1-like protein [Limulus polyphemus]XP_022250958.1 SRR1-like protein [Limulus polyphemus]
MNQDGFQVVRGKRKRRKNRFFNVQHASQSFLLSHGLNDNNISDLDLALAKIVEYQKEITDSDFYIRLVNQLENVLQPKNIQQTVCCLGCEENRLTALNLDSFHIVCYGLGNFSSCVSSQYQLALLLGLKAWFNIDNVLLYDPMFSSSEIQLLKKAGCEIIVKNEEGKRSVKTKTLFYMPHCGKPLYNSVLWANWSPDHLPLVVILGNSFNTMMCNTPVKWLEDSVPYIVKVLPFKQETMIENDFRINDIFNDIAVHSFNREKLLQELSDFWEEATEPSYNSDDEIICSSQMK